MHIMTQSHQHLKNKKTNNFFVRKTNCVVCHPHWSLCRLFWVSLLRSDLPRVCLSQSSLTGLASANVFAPSAFVGDTTQLRNTIKYFLFFWVNHPHMLTIFCVHCTCFICLREREETACFRERRDRHITSLWNTSTHWPLFFCTAHYVVKIMISENRLSIDHLIHFKKYFR